MADETSIVDAPWTEGISEENLASVSKYESKDALAGGYRELVSKMGTQVEMPTDETSAENRSAFYQKLGMPGDVSGYTRPTLPEGKALDQEFYDDMAGIAHQHGASDTLFSAMVNRVIERQVIAEELKEKQKIETSNKMAEETTRRLHEDWPDEALFDRNMTTASRVWVEHCPDEYKEEFAALLEEHDLDNNYIFQKVSLAMGEKTMDDTLVKGSPAKEEPGFVPKFPKSAEMYATMEGDEGVKSRKYFEDKGHVYP